MRRLPILSLALVTALSLAATARAADDTIRKGFNVADGGTLRLKAGIGDITIVTGGKGVAIEVIRKADGRRGEERLREHKIEFQQSGNDVIIDGDTDKDTRWNGWFNLSDDYDVQWNIRVPSHYNVDVRTSGGSIDLGDIGGTTEAHTSGGGIKAGKLAGKSNLYTSGGGIRIAGATSEVIAHTSGGGIEVGDTTGNVEVKTSGGSITLSRVGGSVVAHTSGGGIRVDDAMGAVDASTSGGSITARLSRQPRGDSRLATSGGSVTVSIAGGVGVELDAHASGGGVSSDLPITVQGTQDEDSLRGRIGGGGPKLVLRSSGGGVRIKGL
jgi:hypothetical protein